MLAIGRLAPQKGFPLLVQAVDRLRHEGVELQLTIIGEGPLRGTLETAIRARSLESHVRLTGWVSNQELGELLTASRLFVMPSLAEGVPVAIMDAFMHHRPVVVADVGGIAELVEHGKSGWVVPPGSCGPARRRNRRGAEDAFGQAGRNGPCRGRARGPGLQLRSQHRHPGQPAQRRRRQRKVG